MKIFTYVGAMLGYVTLSVCIQGVEKTAESFQPDLWATCMVLTGMIGVFLLALLALKLGPQRYQCVHGIYIPGVQTVTLVAPQGICSECDAFRARPARSLADILRECDLEDAKCAIEDAKCAIKKED